MNNLKAIKFKSNDAIRMLSDSSSNSSSVNNNDDDDESPNKKAKISDEEMIKKKAPLKIFESAGMEDSFDADMNRSFYDRVNGNLLKYKSNKKFESKPRIGTPLSKNSDNNMKHKFIQPIQRNLNNEDIVFITKKSSECKNIKIKPSSTPKLSSQKENAFNSRKFENSNDKTGVKNQMSKPKSNKYDSIVSKIKKEAVNNENDPNNSVKIIENENDNESNDEKLRKIHLYIEKMDKLKRDEQKLNEVNEKLKNITNNINEDKTTNDLFDSLSIKPSFENDKNIGEVIKVDDNSSSDDEDGDDDLVVLESKKKPIRVFNYKFVDKNDEIEEAIDKIKNLGQLTKEHIEYLVLLDVNYFVNIFAGQNSKSWRHLEYKKLSKTSSKILYSNSRLTSYTEEQYMAAVKALQKIFSKNTNKYDDYLVKVLLPEALIKICMKIYQCSKDNAEDYLFHNNANNPIEFYYI